MLISLLVFKPDNNCKSQKDKRQILSKRPIPEDIICLGSKNQRVLSLLNLPIQGSTKLLHQWNISGPR